MALSDLDRELLHQCLAADEHAWALLVDRYLGLVTHVVNHTAHCRAVRLSAADREDLIAEVFVALLENDMGVLRRFQERSSLATYLVVVARRVVVHRLMHNAKGRFAGPTNGQGRAEQADPRASVEQRLGNQDQVDQMLDGLGDSEAKVVRMFHLEGKSYHEISRVVGVPENSIGPLLSRARALLRRNAGIEG